MDWQIIILGIGVFISLVLGLINFLWGPAILARREKVAIVNPEVYAEFEFKGTRGKTYGGIYTFHNYVVLINARCELILTSGEKELEVKGVGGKRSRSDT